VSLLWTPNYLNPYQIHFISEDNHFSKDTRVMQVFRREQIWALLLGWLSSMRVL